MILSSLSLSLFLFLLLFISVSFFYLQELMVNFFNEKMLEAKLCSAPGLPVLAVQINMDKNFAFIEVSQVTK